VLHELSVRDLGVVDRLRLAFAEGMTAVTGETGAGKTLVVEAIDLLVGGRADAGLVRDGAAEAVVEGRFELDGEELVLSRVIPSDGRSRAYVNDRLVTVSTLADLGSRLVDLHGQHAHQSLLTTPAQRAALDAYGGVDLAPLAAAREELARLDARLSEYGGDQRGRAREVDLLRFQVDEIGAASLQLGEDRSLVDEADLLGDAAAHQEAADRALDAIEGEGGASERLGEGIQALRDRSPFEDLNDRLRLALVELEEALHDLRARAETIRHDPERLEEIQNRRRLIADLQRKYGDTLEDVTHFAAEAQERLDELESWDERAGVIERDRTQTLGEIESLEDTIAGQRREAATGLTVDVVEHLHQLSLPHAQLVVEVGGQAGDEVDFLMTANPGSPPRPLRKVASGGELARVMLALRLVLTAGPPILVFDEVDAGVGGAAAVSVGRALAVLAPAHQVLVVTHLPQVAAFADQQVAVTKAVEGGSTVTRASVVDDADRVVELSRMLAGSPDSTAAQEHAEELLAVAAQERDQR
jgi:DNA repair protein RecN (Recombination protein N)